MSIFTLAVAGRGGLPAQGARRQALDTQPGYTREGIIVMRAYPASLGLTEQAYREILWGGATPPSGATSVDRLAWAQRRLDNLCVERVEFHNIACNAGRTATLNFIGNLATSTTGANVFAVGTGNISATPAASTDTQLLNEVYRAATSNATVSGNNVLINCFFGTSQANFTYTEAGIFSVAAPPGSANTGTLYAHAAYSYTKTSSISLTNDYYIYLN